jgi:hypothetical protein
MGKYVLVYKGGAMAETPEAQDAAMAAWGAWFGTLGDAISDMGAPFGTSTAVTSDGSRVGASSGASGYSILTADSLDAAADLAKGCPILADGGDVEVFETIEM